MKTRTIHAITHSLDATHDEHVAIARKAVSNAVKILNKVQSATAVLVNIHGETIEWPSIRPDDREGSRDEIIDLAAELEEIAYRLRLDAGIWSTTTRAKMNAEKAWVQQ